MYKKIAFFLLVLTLAFLAACSSSVEDIFMQSPAMYTVVFDPNGGIGSVQTQSFTVGTEQSLLPNYYYRDGYRFSCWNTSAYGYGTNYKNVTTVKDLATENGAVVILYAQWTPYSTYTVTFNANGGTGTMAAQTFYVDTAQALTKNAFTKEYYAFAGWNTAANGSGTNYTDEEEVKNLADRYYSYSYSNIIMLYAQWTPSVHYTVVFNANGGEGDDVSQSFTIDVSQTLTENTFTKDGQSFLKWNTKADGSGTDYADAESVKNLTTTDGDVVTLYAQWIDGIIINSKNYESVLKNLSAEGTYTIYYIGALPTDYSWSTATTTILSKISELIDDLYPAKVTLDFTETINMDSVSGFAQCRSLEKITLPDGITTIGSFSGCVNLQYINIPNSVTSISSFADCKSLATVTLSNNLTSIAGSVFSNCTSLTDIVIPDSVKSIGSYAFEGCTSLASVTLPEKLRTIGSHAFSECSSLTSIVIPNEVIEIGGWSFEKCSKLQSVTIPNSVAYIRMYAFSNCTKLATITFTGTTAEWNAVTKESNWKQYVTAKKIICTDGEGTL